MRLKAFATSLFIALFCVLTLQAHAQEQDGDEPAVRGAFLTSRPSASNSQPTSTHKTSVRKTTPPPQTSSRRTTPKSTGPGGSAAKDNGASNNGMGDSNPKSLTTPDSNGGNGVGGDNLNGKTTNYNGNNVPATALALGYTLYMMDANGDAVRVDPSREFHNGDRVRIALEPNTDSYLYVFHTENNGQPEMIFPDARLNGGDNFIAAHVPTEIPSGQEQNERLRWFTFYGQPATERLYIVITRQPLPLVPTGEDLGSYCQANKDRCPWHPPAQIWAQVQKEMNARVLVNKEKGYGQAQTTREREATTRGFGLDQSAPAPSVIRMNATSNAPVLVTALDLVHQ